MLPASTSQLRDRIAALKLPGTIRLGPGSAEPLRHLRSGVASVDSLLGGGVPRGRVCEIVGRPSAGRTAFAYRLLAASSRAGELAAIVDTPDGLDPHSLEESGTDLRQILWVRPVTVRNALKSAEMVLAAGGFAVVLLDLAVPRIPGLALHVWPRLAQAARQSGSALVVLAPFSLAGSFSVAVVKMGAGQGAVLLRHKLSA